VCVCVCVCVSLSKYESATATQLLLIAHVGTWTTWDSGREVERKVIGDR
jgi:hypothetical protein